ncbi:hypothetical protein [Acinetobacter vivianii]|uniref:hypothetical protein n=1 Tax=Acinetobacter vivianii TaxID=1776742 RepID=UPI001903903F|nr:hypothetical protein [Acinetobacter vivianii]MBJ8482591.1 hypothetical protein [Acinetobacter vivianii]
MNTKLPDHKQLQAIQSWYEPALKTLVDYLEIRKENLRRINRDEANAAVTKDEFVEALSRAHRMTYGDAGLIIASLLRADKIIMFGRFIQLKDQGGEQ